MGRYLTPAEKAEAKRLRDREGLGASEIARILGYSRQTISRHLAPNGLARRNQTQRGWKDRQDPEELRAQRRRYEKEKRTKCPDCGRRKGGKNSRRCIECIKEDRHFKNKDFEAMWLRGASAQEIALAQGIKVSMVYKKAERLRQYGYNIPYRAEGAGRPRTSERSSPEGIKGNPRTGFAGHHP